MRHKAMKMICYTIACLCCACSGCNDDAPTKPEYPEIAAVPLEEVPSLEEQIQKRWGRGVNEQDDLVFFFYILLLLELDAASSALIRNSEFEYKGR